MNRVMNAIVVQIISAAVGAAVGGAGGAIFYYGKLTQRVNDQGARLTTAEGKVDNITERVCHLEGAGVKSVYVNGAAAGGAN